MMAEERFNRFVETDEVGCDNVIVLKQSNTLPGPEDDCSYNVCTASLVRRMSVI